MYRVWFVLFAILLVFSIWFSLKKPVAERQRQPASSSPSQQEIIVTPVTAKDTILFVPYWAITPLSEASSYAYFGISLTEDGIDTSDAGYLNLPSFLQKVPRGKKTLLVVRMLSQNSNEQILQDKELQAKLIAQVTSFAREKQFDGVILDFEYNAIAFDSVIASVTDFSTDFADGMQDKNLLAYQAIYGDVMYRLRPFNIAEIAKHTDGILVMAYDLHKANGDPGPNFPLESTTDYTLLAMMNDFQKYVPSEKLTIILGMFGYDWKVNSKGLTIGQAQAVTNAEAAKLFSFGCVLKKCIVSQQSDTAATRVRYIDSANNQHEVWFDSAVVVQKKKELIGKRGVGKVAYWANSYF